MFLLFRSPNHLKKLQNFCHVDMSFTMKIGQSKQMSLLDNEIVREQKKFNTTVFRKHTFSGIYPEFHSYLPGS